MKYMFLEDDYIYYKNMRLHRIKRVSDGLLGGYIQFSNNLSQEGSCFVYEGCKVFGNCLIKGSSQIKGNVIVKGLSTIENTNISGISLIEDATIINSNLEGLNNINNATITNSNLYGVNNIVGVVCNENVYNKISCLKKRSDLYKINMRHKNLILVKNKKNELQYEFCDDNFNFKIKQNYNKIRNLKDIL